MSFPFRKVKCRLVSASFACAAKPRASSGRRANLPGMDSALERLNRKQLQELCKVRSCSANSAAALQ